jgi:CHASE1-domain containing sensor protein
VDAVAITAIVVGGVVSLTATALTIWAENRRQRQRTADERLNELRDVLDRGGGALTSALYAFDRRKVSRTPSESAESGPDFNRKVEEVEAMEARIAIRLGEEEPTTAIYQEARKCFRDLRALVFDAGEDWTSKQKDRADDLRAQVVKLRLEYLELARIRANPRP